MPEKKPAPTVKLDADFAAFVRGPMRETYAAIAPDVWGEYGAKSNREAVEMVIDSSHVETYGGRNAKSAAAWISTACREHGYDRVLRFLAKNVSIL